MKRLLIGIIILMTIVYAFPCYCEQEEANKVSLDIKGMEVVDVLKMLATRAGMNIIVGKNVSGRVTLFLKDVDVKDAFELVIVANDLAYEKKAGIVNVMTQSDHESIYGERFQDKKQVKIVKLKYQKAADIARSLQQIKTNLGRVIADEIANTVVLIDSPAKNQEMVEFIKNADQPLKTEIFSLNYASAEKLSAKLQEALTKGAGSLKIDERTNKIAITDFPEKLSEISKIIAEFDEKTPQVLIDAQIVQVSPTDLFEMGVNWDYWIEKYFEAKASLPVGTANRLFIGTTSANPTRPGQYKAVMDILRTIGDTKVLSSPRVMALNNQEAKIHVGTRDAYITSTTSQSGNGTTVTSQSVNFVDTGIQLYVTPMISKDGFVTMKIKPEISDSTRTDITSEGQITQVPIVSTSEAETTVTVKDGVTIVIGGLRKDKREKTVKKIPVLGDIPGIGFLFRSTSDNITKSDLVILLTPHIITGEKSLVDFEEIKPKDGAVAEMVNGEIITKKTGKPNYKHVVYFNKITDKVKKASSNNSNSLGKGSVEVLFALNPAGKIIYGPKVVASTNHDLDEMALKSVILASPFEPFPKQMIQEAQNFSIILEYN